MAGINQEWQLLVSENTEQGFPSPIPMILQPRFASILAPVQGARMNVAWWAGGYEVYRATGRDKRAGQLPLLDATPSTVLCSTIPTVPWRPGIVWARWDARLH